MQAEEIATKWKLIDEKFDKMAVDNFLTTTAISLFREAIASKPPIPFKPQRTERLQQLLSGEPYPPESDGAIFGEDEEEYSSRIRFAESNPSRDEFYTRLRNFRSWLTDKKATDILVETPSKRLFIRRFAAMKPVEMKEFFVRHYRFSPSQAVEFAKFTQNIINTDQESGIQRRAIETEIARREQGLRRAVHGLTSAQIRAAAREIRTERNQESVRGDEAAADVAVAKRTAETEVVVTKLSEEVEEQRAHLQRVRSQLEHAEDQLREMQRRLLARKTAAGDKIAREKLLEIDPAFRLNWMTRLNAIVGGATQPGPSTVNQHQELYALLGDFQRCAISYSKLIVQEYFLPESQKLVRASYRRKSDLGLTEKSIFEVHHIRFVVQMDYDGIYDGDHTNAMKCGGNALRASKTLFEKNLTGVMVPLQACIDYAGFRVLATVRSHVL